MGIRSSSATYVRYHIPEALTEDFWSYVDERLNDGVFKDLEDGEERALGFAAWEDFFDSTFSQGSYHKGEYVAFNFRLDQRRVPAVITRQYVREAVQKYRDEQGGRWPSRKERQEIHENVQTWLLNRAFPQPSACEVVWNPAGKSMIVGTTSAKMLEAFLEHFENRFKLYPIPMYHAQWALNGIPLDGRQKDTLSSMISVKSPTAMEEGRFLGFEFLTWLWFFSERSGGSFRISEEKEAEVHLGERLVLMLPGEGKEKVVCTTQANFLDEARMALKRGKLVHEIQLLLMVADNEYLLTLDSALWAVKGLKAPKQLQDYEEEDADGLFLEKMYFLEEVSSALDVLYGKFLAERLGSAWDSDTLPLMKQWIEAPGEEEQAAPAPSSGR